MLASLTRSRTMKKIILLSLTALRQLHESTRETEAQSAADCP